MCRQEGPVLPRAASSCSRFVERRVGGQQHKAREAAGVQVQIGSGVRFSWEW